MTDIKQIKVGDTTYNIKDELARTTAYQKPGDGIPLTDLANAVQTSLGRADAAAPQATTYTKEEINNLINPLDAEIVWVDESDWPLGSGTANTIYCVQGSSSFTAYGWDGTDFQELATYAWIVDDVPTAESDNAVKSGGVFEKISPLEDKSEALLKMNAIRTVDFSAIGTIRSYINYETGIYVGSDVYVHSRISVHCGEIVEVTANSEYDSRVAFFKSNVPTIPAKDDVPDYAQGYNNVVSIKAGKTKTFTTPDDATLLYIYRGAVSSSYPYTPSSVKIYSNTMGEKVFDINSITLGAGRISDGVWNNTSRYKHIVIPVNAGEVYEVVGGDSSIYALLKDYNTPYDSDPVIFKESTGLVSITRGNKVSITIPDDVKYLYFYAGDTNTTNGERLYLPGSLICKNHVENGIKTLQDENLKCGAKVSFTGFGDAYNRSSCPQVFGVVPGLTYRVYYVNKATVHSGTRNYPRIYIRSVDGSGTKTELVRILQSEQLPDYSDVTMPANSVAIEVSGRCALGQVQEMVITQLWGDVEDQSSVFAFNPDSEFKPKIEALKKSVRYSSNMSPESVVFGHISDCHGNSNSSSSSATNWNRFIEFMNHWSDSIDDVIDTGDMVLDNYTDGIAWRTNAQNVLTIIGNHDPYEGSETSEGAMWRNHIGTDCYDTYLKDNVDNWNVEQPDDADTLGKCYYYKDYSKSKTNGSTTTTLTIRAIFLDCMAWGYGDDSEKLQAQWLEDVLEDAASNSYKVVIFCHFPPMRWRRIECDYSSMYKDLYLGSLPGWSSSYFNRYFEEAARIVYKFQVGGGTFLGYVCGHYHYDCVGQIGGCWNFSTHEDGNVADAWDGDVITDDTVINFDDEQHPQMVFAVGSGNVGLRDNLYDYKMVAGTQTNDNFQLIAFNAHGNTVRLAKVGCNVDVHMRRKDTVEVFAGTIDSFNPSKTDYKQGNRVEKDGLIYRFVAPVVVNGATSWEDSVKVLSSRVNI